MRTAKIVGALAASLFLTAGAVSQQCAAPSPAAVGGDFTLLDGQGDRVTQGILDNKFGLIYFGFTYCPDVCPTELAKIASALDKLQQQGKKLDRVQPVFISLDPERDTPDAVATYTDLFHPKLIGLTGSQNQINAAAKAYRVFHRKACESGEPEQVIRDGRLVTRCMPGDTEYTIEHSSLIFLMDRRGELITFFAPNASPDDIVASLSPCL